MSTLCRNIKGGCDTHEQTSDGICTAAEKRPMGRAVHLSAGEAEHIRSNQGRGQPAAGADRPLHPRGQLRPAQPAHAALLAAGMAQDLRKAHSAALYFHQLRVHH